MTLLRHQTLPGNLRNYLEDAFITFAMYFNGERPASIHVPIWRAKEMMGRSRIKGVRILWTDEDIITFNRY